MHGSTVKFKVSCINGVQFQWAVFLTKVFNAHTSNDVIHYVSYMKRVLLFWVFMIATVQWLGAQKWLSTTILKDATYTDICFNDKDQSSYLITTASSIETNGKVLTKHTPSYYLIHLDRDSRFVKKVDLGGIIEFPRRSEDRFTQVILLNDKLYIGRIRAESNSESMLSVLIFDLDFNWITEFPVATFQSYPGYNINRFLRVFNNNIYSILTVDHTTEIDGVLYKEAPGEDRKKLLFVKLENKSVEVFGEFEAEFDAARSWRPGALNVFAVDSLENFYFSYSMITTWDEANYIHKYTPNEGGAVFRKLGPSEVQCLEIVKGKLRAVGIFRESILWGKSRLLDEDYGYGFFEGAISLSNQTLSDFKHIMPTRHHSRFSDTDIPTVFKKGSFTLVSHNLNSTTNALIEGKDQKPLQATAFLSPYCDKRMMDQITFNGAGKVLIQRVFVTDDKVRIQGRLLSNNTPTSLVMAGDTLWPDKNSNGAYGQHSFIIEIENSFPRIGSNSVCFADSFFAKNVANTYDNYYWIIGQDTFYEKDIHLRYSEPKRDYIARFVGEKWNGFQFKKNLPIVITATPTSHFELEDSLLCQGKPLSWKNFSHIDSNFNLKEKLKFKLKAFDKNGTSFVIDTKKVDVPPGVYSIYLTATDGICSDTSDTTQFILNPSPLKGFDLSEKRNFCPSDSIWVADWNDPDSNSHVFVWNSNDSFYNFHYRKLSAAGLYRIHKKVTNKYDCFISDDTSIWVTKPDSFLNQVRSYHVASHWDIAVNWEPHPLSGEQIELEVLNNSGATLFLSKSDSSFIHKGSFPNDSVYTYQITQIDSCMNRLENLVKAQNIVLSLKAPLTNPYTIAWNDISKVNDEEVEYTLEGWRNGEDWNYLRTTKDTSAVIRFGEYIGYKDSIGLRITGRSKALTSLSNTLWVKDPTETSQQNVFLDSVLFEIRNLPEGSRYHFIIFDVVGRILYETVSVNEEKIPFEPSPSATYLYHLINELPTGEMKRRYGHLVYIHR